MCLVADSFDLGHTYRNNRGLGNRDSPRSIGLLDSVGAHLYRTLYLNDWLVLHTRVAAMVDFTRSNGRRTQIPEMAPTDRPPRRYRSRRNQSSNR